MRGAGGGARLGAGGAGLEQARGEGTGGRRGCKGAESPRARRGCLETGVQRTEWSENILGEGCA